MCVYISSSLSLKTINTQQILHNRISKYSPVMCSFLRTRLYLYRRLFPLIEAGSQIQVRSLIEAGGLTANTIELMVLVHRTVMRCVIRDVLQYVLVLDYGNRCSKKRKTYTLKLEAGEPVGSNTSRVSNTSRGLLVEEIRYCKYRYQ